MASLSRTALVELERGRSEFGLMAARRKHALVAYRARVTLRDAASVVRLHEALLFHLAVPDDAPLLAAVTEALAAFGRRRDVRRFRRALADSGIAGTDLHFTFYWYTARWLVARWPGALRIDWAAFEQADQVEELLPLLLPYCETLTTDQLTYAPRTWLLMLKRTDETDAAFLVRRFAALASDGFGQEAAYDRLAVPLVLRAGPGTPARSTTRDPRARVHFQAGPLRTARPDLKQALATPVRSIRAVGAREGARLLDLTRSAMVTRLRDLDAFEKADVRDVRVIDAGEGLTFACFGVVPERRLMLEAVYGFLTLKNGVPMGYVLASALFGSSEVAYNVFETWRGAESAHVYGRVLAMLHALFGSTAFAVDPYQLGHDNAEGAQSGAWWFYEKLGFRPVEDKVDALYARERARLAASPGRRSSARTVDRLAAGYMLWHAGRTRPDVLGRVALENVGLRLSAALAAKGGGDREGAIAAAVVEARALLGLRTLAGWSKDERMALERWAPLVTLLPGVAGWPVADRRALARVVRAKGGRRESEFVARFDRHARLRQAILSLARPRPQGAAAKARPGR